jgi:NAD(P)-dependent dehydrogenase (short-subunit alcohol dehydrogenase family)
MIANAGVQGDFAPVHEHDVAVARHVLEVNVVGVFNTLQAAARLMIAGDGGSIRDGVDGRRQRARRTCRPMRHRRRR